MNDQTMVGTKITFTLNRGSINGCCWNNGKIEGINGDEITVSFTEGRFRGMRLTLPSNCISFETDYVRPAPTQDELNEHRFLSNCG